MQFSRVKIVFLGDRASEFSNRFFAHILETPAELRAVMDSPPRTGASMNPSRGDLLPGGAGDFFEYAKQAGIPTRRPHNPNSAATCDWLRRLAPDLVVSVGFFGILKAGMLSIPRLAAVNFHASLLPAYRGKHPVFWALFHGEQRTGITAHIMSERIDEGEIIYQRAVPVRAHDSVATLYARVIAAGLPLVDQLIGDAARGKIPMQPQPSAEASCFSSPTDEDFRIDWTMSATALEARIRAAEGKCFFAHGQQCIHVREAALARAAGNREPLKAGRFAVHSGRLKIGTGKGELWLVGVAVDGVQLTGVQWHSQVRQFQDYTRP